MSKLGGKLGGKLEMTEETYRRWGVIFQALTAAAVIYGVVEGLDSWEKSQKLEKTRLQNEFLSEFWEQRVRAHFDAAGAAAILAHAIPGTDTWNQARIKFFELYQGRLAVVEDLEVCEAMVAFGSQLKIFEESKKGVDHQALKNLALNLARKIRTSLKNASEETDKLKPIPGDHDCN